MVTLAYHASHEQFSPAELLTYVKLAEKAGFNACHASDHFHPWSERQGQSGFVFSWLGAAMEATQLPFSVITAPGQRYHPAIIAQAIATLLQMYPGRLTTSLGSGEALNESITGDVWPEKTIRNARLLESVQVMRRLLAGEQVTHEGLIRVRHAKLYTRPDSVPIFLCAALSEETAHWAGSWADGLLTTWQTEGKLQQIIAAFNAGGGAGKPVHLKLTFSYARDAQRAAMEAHHQWRLDCVVQSQLAELDSVAAFDEATHDVSIEQVTAALPIINSMETILRLVNKIEALGVQHIILHNVGRNQEEFITDFETHIFRKSPS